MIDQRAMERLVGDQPLYHELVEGDPAARDRGGPVGAPHDELAEK